MAKLKRLKALSNFFPDACRMAKSSGPSPQYYFIAEDPKEIKDDRLEFMIAVLTAMQIQIALIPTRWSTTQFQH